MIKESTKETLVNLVTGEQSKVGIYLFAKGESGNTWSGQFAAVKIPAITEDQAGQVKQSGGLITIHENLFYEVIKGANNMSVTASREDIVALTDTMEMDACCAVDCALFELFFEFFFDKHQTLLQLTKNDFA